MGWLYPIRVTKMPIQQESRSKGLNSVDGSARRRILFGKYKLGKLIGHGAVGKVYHAHNLYTGECVAIKAMSKGAVLDGGLAEYIKREISTVGHRLQHRHVIRLFEVLATKTKIYLVMEYARGGDLLAQVSRGRFSEDLARRYFRQLISAVRYCHSRGVYHRDLKPENLLLDGNLDLKVCDFGFSALADQIRHPDEQLRTLCGTPAYVAPEVLSQRGYSGASADVWSIGVILYVLTAGSLPFYDQNVMEMFRKIYRGHYWCPPWMSQDLKGLLSRILDTNPATRISMDEIAADPWVVGECNPSNVEFHGEVIEISSKEEELEDEKFTYMNAFDLIATSSGCDLSGLLGSTVSGGIERFISAAAPEEILAKVEMAAEKEVVLVVERKRWVVKVEKGGDEGRFGVEVEVRRLTEELVVVEVGRTERDDDGLGLHLWESKLRPRLSGLIM